MKICIYLFLFKKSWRKSSDDLANLAQVLSRLQSAGMRLKQQKSAFLLASVSYLGHVISEGLHTSAHKVKAIVDAPDPRDITELRSSGTIVIHATEVGIGS